MKKRTKTPLVGRITRLKRTWWFAYVPAIGAAAQASSPRKVVSTLRENIERMFRPDGEPVVVAVSVLGATVKDGAKVRVTCDRPGLLDARVAEFKRLLAEADGPNRNPYIAPIRCGDFIIANHVDPRLPPRPTNMQRVEHMRWRATLVAEASGRLRRMPASGLMRAATIHRLSLIGVAAAATTKAFRAKHPSVPWRDAIAMRKFSGKPDRLLDEDALRKAVRETVPALVKALAHPDLDMPDA